MPTELAAEAIDPISSLEFFTVLNHNLRKLPARDSELALMAQFSQIGVGRNSEFAVNALSPAAKRGLERAVEDGEAIVLAATQRTIPNYNADGSLTLTLQHEKPQNPNANWLPMPEGMFMLVMRLYEPSNAALGNDYLLPRLQTL